MKIAERICGTEADHRGQGKDAAARRHVCGMSPTSCAAAQPARAACLEWRADAASFSAHRSMDSRGNAMPWVSSRARCTRMQQRQRDTWMIAIGKGKADSSSPRRGVPGARSAAVFQSQYACSRADATSSHRRTGRADARAGHPLMGARASAHCISENVPSENRGRPAATVSTSGQRWADTGVAARTDTQGDPTMSASGSINGEEFDIVDVAAAAVKLAHAAAGGEESLQTRTAAASATREQRRFAAAGHGLGAAQRLTGCFVGVGRDAAFGPRILWGDTATRHPSRELGAIEIADRFSLVEVPEDLVDDIVMAMKKATLRGQTVTIRRDRDAV